MAKINLLDKKVYNRISAGEVVERPASMVKELVENSLDAGATKIEVQIENGGVACVTVRDNGAGIEKDQLPRAFLPHATSKIEKASDLDAILTLGFRGEALASIGAVCKAQIITKTENETSGCAIDCTGGELSEVYEYPSETGTTVICRDLFYNTPARAKFLKSERAEEGEVLSVITKLAFSNPNASLKLTANGKTLLETFGGGLKECVSAVYGVKTLEQCFMIESEKSGIKLSGFIGKLTFTKPTRAYQTLIVNGRCVTDSTVSVAVQNAYGSYLMKRQYPFYVLNLEIPPEAVDVNVHPRKAEVRFSNNQIVYSAVYSSVSKVLDGVSEAVNIIKDDGLFGNKSGALYAGASDEKANEKLSEKVNEKACEGADEKVAKNAQNDKKSAYMSFNAGFGANISGAKVSDSPFAFGLDGEKQKISEAEKSAKNPYAYATVRDVASERQKSENGESGYNFGFGAKNVSGGYAGSFEPEDGVDIFAENKKYIEKLEREKLEKAEKSDNGGISESIKSDGANGSEVLAGGRSGDLCETDGGAGQTAIKVEEQDFFVGQAFDTYLIFTRGSDMYFIDQHAAHERLLYDELCEKVSSNSVIRQELLIPYTFYVSASDFNGVYERLDYFREIGIEIDALSNGGFCVSAVPIELCEIDLKKFFDDLLYDNSFKREKIPLTIKEKLMQTACKHAIKGGDKLDKSEIDALMKKVSHDLGLKCPHGRPIAIKITRTELEKWFKRIV